MPSSQIPSWAIFICLTNLGTSWIFFSESWEGEFRYLFFCHYSLVLGWPPSCPPLPIQCHQNFKGNRYPGQSLPSGTVMQLSLVDVSGVSSPRICGLCCGEQPALNRSAQSSATILLAVLWFCWSLPLKVSYWFPHHIHGFVQLSDTWCLSEFL